jgi:uncharacterized protein YndB with AHSA1/START domain
MEAVEREVTVAAEPDEVWRAVTDSGELSAWFGAEVELDPRPGGRGVFRWGDGAERHAVVEDVEPERRLAFRWLPFQRTADRATIAMPPTRVEITLEPVGPGTRVRVVEQPAFPARAGLRARRPEAMLAGVAP